MEITPYCTIVQLIVISLLHIASSVNLDEHELRDGKDQVRRWKRQQGNEEEDNGQFGCVVQCISIIAKSVNLDSQGASQNPLDTGSSLLCSSYNKEGLDNVCRGYIQGMRCLEHCTDGTVKNVTRSGFDFLPFLCIERKTDFEKTLPCISNSCPASEQMCKPNCGIIKNSSKDDLTRIADSLGLGSGNGQQATGNIGESDLFGIKSTVAENCRYASCYLNCSKAPLTEKCGRMAYSLYEEMIWRMITSGTRSFTALGLGSVWPQECKTFSTTYEIGNTSNSTSANTTVSEITQAPESSLVNNATMPIPGNVTLVPAASCKNGNCDTRGSGATTNVVMGPAMIAVTMLAATIFYTYF